MIEIGKYNQLNVVKRLKDAVVLEAGPYGEVLLPLTEVPQESQENDSLEVFLYYNSKEEVVPTTHKPYGVVGEFACLKVVEVSDIGAFLNWGLPKDLFVPIGAQKHKMKKGESYIVYIYKDPKRDRLAASSKIDSFLDKEPSHFLENQKVNLLIAHETESGINAIINHTHWGLLYHDEIFQTLEYGQSVEGYIKKVRDDEKIDLSLHALRYRRMDALEEKIMAYLQENGGESFITDKSEPEVISKLFGVSKKKYKMALGALYKDKQIIIEDKVIRSQ